MVLLFNLEFSLTTRNRSNTFLNLRKSKSSTKNLDSNLIQLRLSKLTTLFKENNHSNTQVVPWEPDSLVYSCLLCNSTFTLFTRKHHCRLCGKVHCNNCINEYPISDGTKKAVIKTCTTCFNLISFNNHDNAREKYIADVYGLSIKLKSNIITNIDSYHLRLCTLKQKKINIDDPDYIYCLNLRNEIINSINSLSKCTFSFDDGPKKQISIFYTNFNNSINGVCRSFYASLQLMPNRNLGLEISNNLDQEISVLEDQITFLRSSIDDAKMKRRFEDVDILKINLKELKDEFNRKIQERQAIE